GGSPCCAPPPTGWPGPVAGRGPPQSVFHPPPPGGTTMHWPGLALGGQTQCPFLSITSPGGHAAVAGLRPPSASQSRTAAAREKNTRDDQIRIDIGRLPGCAS